jgi:glycosyltransferase involved in cell wall biosynthesis
VKERLAQLGQNVRYYGPYAHDRVDALMRQVDAVVVPSIWWENSPLVIQEALRNRRPVICSDIGGMAEKVRDGLDGFHFPVGSAPALAGLLRELARDRTRLDKVAATLRPPQPAEAVARQHAALYERLLAEPPRIAAV